MIVSKQSAKPANHSESFLPVIPVIIEVTDIVGYDLQLEFIHRGL